MEYALSGYAREDFLNAYVDAMVWTATGSDPKTGELDAADTIADADDIRAAIMDGPVGEDARRDCNAFIAAIEAELSDDEWHEYGTSALRGTNTNVAELAGHDFLLTRDGHGVGFRDRGAGEVGVKLDAIACRFSECSTIVDVDDSGAIVGVYRE